MQGFSKAIQQPEYVHVLLNHFPLTGMFIALLFLVAALIFNSRPAQFFALFMVCLLALSVWPVAHYGERAYDRVLSMTDDEGSQYLKLHAQLADRWMFVYYITSGAAAIALVGGWRKPKFLRPSGTVVAVLAAGSLAVGMLIAEAGGKVRHREFRYGPPPKVQSDNDSD